jgi:hypothetical protein
LVSVTTRQQAGHQAEKLVVLQRIQRSLGHYRRFCNDHFLLLNGGKLCHGVSLDVVREQPATVSALIRGSSFIEAAIVEATVESLHSQASFERVLFCQAPCR